MARFNWTCFGRQCAELEAFLKQLRFLWKTEGPVGKKLAKRMAWAKVHGGEITHRSRDQSKGIINRVSPSCRERDEIKGQGIGEKDPVKWH